MNYELTFIVGTNIPETEHPKLQQDILDYLQKNGAVISKAPYFIGRKKLAYPIKKQKHGFYISLDFATDNMSSLKELDTMLKHNSKILRHLLIKKELGADDKKVRPARPKLAMPKLAMPKSARPKTEPIAKQTKPELKIDLADIEKRLDEILASEPDS